MDNYNPKNLSEKVTQTTDVIVGTDARVLTELIHKYGFVGVLDGIQKEFDSEQATAKVMDDSELSYIFSQFKGRIKRLILALKREMIQ